MAGDREGWPEDIDPDDDPTWLPPLDGKTPAEYLESSTEMVYQDVAALLSDYEFGETYPDGRKYGADEMLHAIVCQLLFNGATGYNELDSWHDLESTTRNRTT